MNPQKVEDATATQDLRKQIALKLSPNKVRGRLDTGIYNK